MPVARTAALAAALCGGLAGNATAMEEVPFITTPDHVTAAMLQLAGVGASDYVIDLGSGDGRIVITAARVHGARGLGVEIVPDLVAQSRELARRAGVADRAEFREQDLFATDLSPASVVTMYLLPEVNLQLRPRLLALKPGTRIVSHDWDLGDWRPDRTLVLDVPDKVVGLDKRSRLHLWTVPAAVQGRWCGTGAQHGWQLDLSQQFQRVQGRVEPGGLAIDATVSGLDLASADGLALRLVDGPARALAVRRADGAWSMLAGARFEPAAAAGCPR
ncbi:cyclopropane-fatty-acyl-phospholipid synthase family protein [Ideonella sp. A 288]|uniref:SAM-dependent methyltransferase n=1 Tax=Ideonella sp. A 288 TaxID=1962181 RepID=UPI0011866B22|nr:class I SAM-dependent methyltransferase [Ideonella sp. A 288]